MIYSNIPWRHRIGIAAITCSIVYPAYTLAKYPDYYNYKPRPEKTVVVTRALTDLGKATTINYAVRKCRVIMGCENLEECQSVRRHLVVESNNRSLVCRQLDMQDIDSINRFVDEISESEPHVDVLVNNTTYRSRDNQKKTTKYGIEKHFFQNFLGPYLLTLRLLPKLEESAAHQREARIVTHVDKAKKNWTLDLNDINFEKRAYKKDKAYKQSQLALAYFTLMLDKKLRDQNSKVCVFANGCKAKKYGKIFEKEHRGSLHSLITYFTPSPLSLTHSSVFLGLDELLGLKESGQIFTYLHRCWGTKDGWGWISAGDPVATLLWNHAAELLVNLPKVGDEVVGDNASTSSEDKAIGKESQDSRQ